MKVDYLKISKIHLVSPFFDTKETIKIKKYLIDMISEEEFGDLSVGIIQFVDTPTLDKKLKLCKNDTNIKTIASVENGKVIIDWEQLKKEPSILKYYTIERNAGAYYNASEKNKIWVLIDNHIHNNSKISHLMHFKYYSVDKDFVQNCCTSIRFALYHEARHAEQFKKKDNSFNSIMAHIDNSIVSGKLSKVFYHYFHDKFYIEIDANISGFEKTKKYIQEHPNDYKMVKSTNQELGNYYRLMEYGYDFDNFFTIYNMNRHISSFKNKEMFDCTEMEWHKLLYGNKKGFRNFNDIVNDDLMYEVDPKFLCYVFASECFNKNLNYNDLSEQALEILSVCFDEMHTLTEKNIEKILDLEFQQKKYRDLKFKCVNDLRKRLTRYEKSLELVLVARNEKQKNKKNR